MYDLPKIKTDKISFNIVYSDLFKSSPSGTLNYYPVTWRFYKDTIIKDFLSQFRDEDQIKELFQIADNNYVTPSSLYIYFCYNDINHKFRLINTREFRKFWEKKYKKKWKQNKL